jgi:multidrug efflux system membrane fusion protein
VTSRINFKYLMLAFLMTGVAAISGWLLGLEKATPNAQQTAPQPAATPPVAVVNGVTVVTMDTATQIQNGIRAEPLTSSETPAEITAYGTVLDLQPLIDLRTRYVAGLADADTASAALSASRQEYRRSLALYQDNQNFSLKSYQAALATYRSDQARTQAAALNLQNIQAAMRQQFGATITHWALDSRSPEFSRLLNRQAVLLRITVPPGDGIAAPIRIKIDANEKRRLPAQLVSPSPQSYPGQRFYLSRCGTAAERHPDRGIPADSQKRHARHGCSRRCHSLVWRSAMGLCANQCGAVCPLPGR